MTLLELQPATAWAGIIPAGLEYNPGDLAVFHVSHDIGGSLPMPQLIGHEPHGAIDMSEELFITLTEIIQPRLAIRRFREAILGAFSMADE